MVNTRVRDMAASSALGGSEKFYADNGSDDVYVTAIQIGDFARTASVLDRVKDTTTTTGTGTLTLAGAPPGFRSLTDVYTIVGQEVTVQIQDTAGNWEINRATLASSMPTTNLVDAPFSTGLFGQNGVEVSDNVTIDPSGTTRADALIEDGSGYHALENAEITGFSANDHLTFSVYIKPGTRSWAEFYIASSPVFNNEVTISYNLSGAGSVGTAVAISGAATIFSTSITAAANGFYRCTATIDIGASATTAAWYVFPGSADDQFGTYTGNSGDTAINVWGFGVWVGNSVDDLTAPIDQLERTQVLASSNNGALVSFGSGTKEIIKSIAGYQVDSQPTMANIVDFGAVGDGVADDTQAFVDFATTYKDQSVELWLPSGKTFIVNQSGALSGPYRLVVHGYGAQLGGTSVTLMGGGYLDRTSVPPKLATVEPGDTSLTLLNAADMALFDGTALNFKPSSLDPEGRGGWMMLAGLDLQGFGFPTNQYRFEFVQLTSVTPPTTLNLAYAVGISLRTDWPTYPGFASTLFPNGGPASVWRMSRNWDCECEIRGVTFPHRSNLGSDFFGQGGRVQKFVDCKFSPAFYASQVKTLIVDNCRIEDNSFDDSLVIDKLCESVTFKNSTISRVLLQSANERVTFDNCRITQRCQGTSKNFHVKDSWIRRMSFGPTLHGANETMTLVNSRINSVDWNEGVAGAQAVNALSNFSFSNGVFTIINAFGPLPWAVPGTRCIFIQPSLGSDGTYRWFPDPFWVLKLTQDVTNTYVTTTLGASLPTWSGVTPSHIMQLPCARFNASGLSGCRELIDISNTSPDKPLFTYSNRQYMGGQGEFPANFPARGRLVQVTVNVIRAYTGVQGTLDFVLHFDTPPGLEYIDMSTYAQTFWNVTVNAKIAGKRIVTPGVVSGLQVGDSIPVLPATGSWFTSGATPAFSANIVSESIQLLPIIQLEFITDMGDLASTDVMVLSSTLDLPEQSMLA